MKKKIILTAAVAIAVFGAIFGYKFVVIRKSMAAMAAMPRPTTTVSTTIAKEEIWPSTLKAVATLASFQGITVKTELAGLVQQVVANSGAIVAQGEALVVLDTASEEAQLAGLEAQAKLAELNLGRARDLRNNGTNTPSDLDAAEAAAEQARAAVAQLRVVIAKKHLVAPFPGRLGIVKVYPGQYLSQGDSIVVLESTDPIHVDFSLPQQEINRVSVGQKVQLTVDACPNRIFEAKITAISPRVADTTRSVDIRATLPNTDGVLRPGMFGHAEVVLSDEPRVVVLPTAAIVYNPYGNCVFVVEGGVAHQRFVETGAQHGSLISVLSGLKPGETVVTSGQIKLRNTSPVQVNNAVTPSENPAPKPSEG